MTARELSTDEATILVGEARLLAAAARGIWMEMPKSAPERAMLEVVTRLALLAQRMADSLECVKREEQSDASLLLH